MEEIKRNTEEHKIRLEKEKTDFEARFGIPRTR